MRTRHECRGNGSLVYTIYTVYTYKKNPGGQLTPPPNLARKTLFTMCGLMIEPRRILFKLSATGTNVQTRDITRICIRLKTAFTHWLIYKTFTSFVSYIWQKPVNDHILAFDFPIRRIQVTAEWVLLSWLIWRPHPAVVWASSLEAYKHNHYFRDMANHSHEFFTAHKEVLHCTYGSPSACSFTHAEILLYIIIESFDEENVDAFPHSYQYNPQSADVYPALVPGKYEF